MRCVRTILLVGALALLNGCETSGLLDGYESSSPGAETIASGLREALSVGSGRVVDALGTAGGFTGSPFHIPLPDELQAARGIAARFGLGGIFDELEAKMNEAAEAAVPEARAIFLGAITSMTFEDAMAVYNGPPDAATRYLRASTEKTLEARMRPLIDEELDQVGATRTLERLLNAYNALPLVDPVDADLAGHVSNYASEAVFTQLAREEAAIRDDPLKRSTELLRRVFGP